jgi:hypothetical protein
MRAHQAWEAGMTVNLSPPLVDAITASFRFMANDTQHPAGGSARRISSAIVPHHLFKVLPVGLP